MTKTMEKVDGVQGSTRQIEGKELKTDGEPDQHHKA